MKKHLAKLPVLILAIGAILRIAGTGAAALWYDEAATYYRTTIPFMRLWVENSDNSGDLLLEIILRPLMLLSHSVWMLRLPSLLAALVSLWLVWKFMRRLEFTLPQQIAAATVAAFLPGLLWIAQDARSYSLLALLFLAAIWFAYEGRWLGLLATCGLMIYAHNVGPIFAIAAVMIALFLHPDIAPRWKNYRLRIGGDHTFREWPAANIMFIFLLALAWAPAIIHMSGMWVLQQPWQPGLTFNWIVYSSMRALWPFQWTPGFMFGAFLILGVTALTVIAFLGFCAFFKVRTNRCITLLAWLLPILGLCAASWITRNNYVLYRTLTPALFPFALWLGNEVGKLRFHSAFLASVWLTVLIFGLIHWKPADRGGGLDQVANQIRLQWQDGDRLVYTSMTVGLPFDYYLSDLPHHWDDTITAPFLATSGITHTDLARAAKHSGRSWVVIPEDGLVSDIEKSLLAGMVQHQAPVYTVRYVQAATINIYLVEEKDLPLRKDN